jgi:hypothetical protein
MQFEMEIDETDLDKLLPKVITEDGIDPYASILGPLGDGIIGIVRSAAPIFSFGPFCVLDMDENAEKLKEMGYLAEGIAFVGLEDQRFTT